MALPLPLPLFACLGRPAAAQLVQFRFRFNRSFQQSLGTLEVFSVPPARRPRLPDRNASFALNLFRGIQSSGFKKPMEIART
eukprot:7698658-Pyramimonas_sp.AAC.1